MSSLLHIEYAIQLFVGFWIIFCIRLVLAFLKTVICCKVSCTVLDTKTIPFSKYLNVFLCCEQALRNLYVKMQISKWIQDEIFIHKDKHFWSTILSESDPYTIHIEYKS